jgi:hypothetical protein
MRSKHLIAIVGAALLAFGAGCTSDKRGQPTASAGGSASNATSPPSEVRTVTATPSSALHDGDRVQVQVRGFDPNERVRLSECASPQAINMAGCGLQPAQQPFLDLGDHGEGTINFVVANTASSGPVSQGESVKCSDQCVLVAVGVSESVSSAAYSPLSFSS